MKGEDNKKKVGKTNRRDFFKSATGSAVIFPAVFSGCFAENNISAISSKANVLDEALQIMADIGPLSNHGPMAAEALIALGKEENVVSFSRIYSKFYPVPYPRKRKPVNSENWKDAIGQGDRAADWADFFINEIRAKNWKDVLKGWINVLAPGLSAAAAHGLIRTGHAIRSLERTDNETRREELGKGLGYWAAYFQKLPESVEKSEIKFSPLEAIEKVPQINPEKVKNTRSIMGKIKALEEFPEFSPVINFIDEKGEAEKIISEITETFATIYVRHANGNNHIGLIHSVTGPAMVRSIIPYLRSEEIENLIRYAWQLGAGIFAVSGKSTVNEEENEAGIKAEDLIEKAAASNEVHAIKFTEACLREFKINPKPIYLKAAKDALGRLGSVG
ncbi:MAG: questin oxidase family protein [Pyrinomonadaceae bacterium]